MNGICYFLSVFTFHVIITLQLTIIDIIEEFIIAIVIDIDVINHRSFRSNIFYISTSRRNCLKLLLQKIITDMRQIHSTSCTYRDIINVFSNIRESFVFIRTRFKISKEIQKNIVTIQRYNDFIYFRSFYSIRKRFGDFNCIFNRCSIGGVHNICIDTHTIVHMFIVGSRPIQSDITNPISNFQRIHNGSIVFVTKFLSQILCALFLYHVIGICISIVQNHHVDYVVIVFRDDCFDFPKTFQHFKCMIEFAEGIFIASHDMCNFGIIQNQNLLLVRVKHIHSGRVAIFRPSAKRWTPEMLHIIAIVFIHLTINVN